MKPKILVTGATGTIGSFLIEYLKDKNADFVALVRNDRKAKILQEKGFKTVMGDFDDIASLENALEGIDKVFLLSVTSPKIPEWQGNVTNVAIQKRVKHIVKISARGSAPDANFNIGQWHGLAEKQIRESGIDFTFLRCHSFMQNLFFEAETIRNKNAIYSPQGDGKIAMVDTRDIAAVAAEVLTGQGYNGKTFLLTGTEAVSYPDIAGALTSLLRREIKFILQTPDEAYKAMIAGGMPQWLADDSLTLNEMYSKNDADEVSPDIQTILKRKPISLEKFLVDFEYKFS